MPQPIEARPPIPQSDALFSPERKVPGLRVILNGQGDGAAMLFDRLRENGIDIVGVVATTKKDKDGNPDPLRAKALEAGITVVNLGDLNASLRSPDDPKFLAAKQNLRDMKADLGVAFYLQAMMDQETVDIPEFGTMQTHYSLLPQNRGRDSMNRSVLAGEDIGISTIIMNEEIDAGDIVDQTSFPNPGDKSQGSLYYQYLGQFVEFVSNSVEKMAIGIDNYRKNGTPLPLQPQDASQATYFPPLTEEDLRVDPEKDTAEEAKRKILAGGPGATLMIEENKYKLGKPTVSEGPALRPGRIIEQTDEGIMIEANGGIITIGRLQKSS